MPTDLNRRDMLKSTLGGAMAVAGLSGGSSLLADDKKRSTRRVLRIAHLTDVHIQPERMADKGLIACLHHVQSLKDKPDIILNGGDSIMDSLAKDKSRTRLQWNLWKQVLKDECSLPIEHCIGNHDVWGWTKSKSGCTGNEDLYGKKWAVDEFGISNRYRSFDRAGWHFIVLDSTFPDGEGYKARLDEAQFVWLADDLAKTPKSTPVLVLSHIPILSAAAYFDGECEETGDWKVPGAWIHIDARRIKNLFNQHPNVKVCLSGHLHLVDRVDYSGVTYLCNGAVSGAWWKGRHQEFDEGYAIVNLYDDGGFDREYIPYGWKAAGE
ncbi:MAG TPA: metallophosphoesterase [Phycisphaerae bacterium]|nr:metallophosphoesterase [Phycisphaerae bacterium]HRW56021.1 metallophosphoesterase [Phycisphaerae bacterium]